ncbi:hypothetical protein JCM8208_007267 [Rhodotorula glutinis]
MRSFHSIRRRLRSFDCRACSRLSTTTTATGAGPAASQRAQLQRSAQCLRSRFVRTPASCVQHKKARRGRQQPAAAADLGSDPPSPPSLHQGAKAALGNKRASSPLPPTRVPAAVPPSLAHHRPTLSSPTPPTINTARSTSTSTSAPALAGPAAAVPNHLLVLAAVVLLGGGFLVYTLAPRGRRPSALKDTRRPSQHTLNRIRQAQEAAATDEATSSSGGGGSTATTSSSSSSSAPARGPLKLVTAGLPAASAAAFSELLPSPACVTSTSAAIMSGLERIGSAVGAATATARGRSRSGSASAKGKERLNDDAEPDEEPVVGISRSPLPSGGLVVPSSAPSLEGLTRRGKGKKGTKAGALPSPVASTSSVQSSSSQKLARASAPRAAAREIGVGSDKVATADSAVQTVGGGVVEASVPSRGHRLHEREDSDPTPPFSTPAEPLGPPPPSTAEASVQTSPRLLPVAPRALPPSPHLGRQPLPAPVARPAILPLPSDLHASFQSTPLDPPNPPRSIPSSSESNASSSSYPIPASPPLSPLCRSRSPTSSSAHRSSSASASASVSASPTSRRAMSPTTSASRRESATSSINGHLAVDSTPSRPRASRRKSGAAGALSLADDAQPRGVVGLPGAVAAPRKGKGDERSSIAGGGKVKGREKERDKERVRDRDDEREQREVLRRPSTASSSSASGASGKGAAGLGLGMSRSTPSRSEDRERDDESVRGSQGGDGRRTDMHGLGVELRESGLRCGELPLDGGYPFPSTGHSDSSGTGAYSNGAHTPGWTPDSSPHPTQRSLSGSSYGAALATPTAQRPPWSPQLMAQQYTMIPAPASTRPPSRGSSLSAPSPQGMGPLTPLHGPTAAELLHHESQQQLQVAQQQQQQAAYALAHAHAQAQVQAQYQHAVAIQLQVQQHHQQQQQQQLVQHHQQQQIVQQQQRQQQQQQMRRRSTMPDPGDGYDGFLSPSAGAAPLTPSGFVYPLSSVASPPIGSTSAPSPLLSSFAAQHHPQQHGSYGLSQGASPTTGSFPSSAQSAHAAAVAAAMYSYGGSPSPAGNYLASPASNNGSPYAHAHASPTQAHFQQSQLSRSTAPSASLARPRLQSSVSAVAALGGNGKVGSSGGGGSSTIVGQSLSQSLGPGGGGKSSRSGSDKAHRSPSTPAGHGSSGSSAPISGGVQLGDPPGGVKHRLRQAEMDADRTAKELEIARWKLAVLEDERKTAEIENQEALRALATRAMRAEARIKLYEEAAKTQSRSSPLEPTTSTPASSTAPSTANSPVVHSALLPVAGLTPIFPDGGSSSPTSTAHPLSWLDLDAVSFQGPRPLHPSSRSPSLLSSPSGNNAKSRNKRHSSGGNSARRTSSNQRRKSSTSPSAAPVAPPELIDSDDDDVLIVLDAPMRRRSVNPLRQTPSRRSSYAPDDEIPEGQDGVSLVDDDEIPTIDVDESEPLSGGALMGESENGTRQHREYIGFLPSRLSPRRVFALTTESPMLDAVECSTFVVENGDVSTLSVPSFTLDASPEPEEEPDSASRPHIAPQAVKVLDSPEEAPTPVVVVKTSGLPSPAHEHSLSPISPTSPDDTTPRMPGPPSPPTSPERRLSSLQSSPRRPEDTPLPPSPLVSASA